MRLLWTLFFSGLVAGGIFSKLLIESRATTAAAPASAPAPKKTEDASISGLKVKMPDTAETEQALVKKEKELEAKEKNLKSQEERLAIEEQRVKARVEELSRLQDDIVAVQKKNKIENEAIFQRLVKTFESMASKKAASVISVMDDKLAVDLFLAMKEKKVAAVLEVMEANRAMQLSSLVARRRPAGRAIGEKEVP